VASRGLFSPELVNPELLDERRQATAIQPRVAVETAWCFEFHEHLEQAIDARRDGIELILMGGHASSLRLVAGNDGRGSRDTDYVTNLDEGAAVEVFEQALASMRAAAEVTLGDLPEGAFVVERVHGPATEEAIPLPLVSNRITVPSVINIGFDTAEIKVELHLLPTEDLPPADSVTDAPFPLSEPRTLKIPVLPWQIAFKLVALASPPVGIPLARDAGVPRQLYDLDYLSALLGDVDDDLRDAVTRVYAKELEYTGADPEDGEPWLGIERRLEEWAADFAAGGVRWTYASQFQDGQVSRNHRIPQAAWAARANRLQLFTRLAAAGDDEMFTRLREIERSIPTARRDNAAAFAAARNLFGARQPGTLHDQYWAYLTRDDDPLAAAERVEEAISESG
jgi:hypothetical protein